MNLISKSELGVLWALTWRAVVAMPVMIGYVLLLIAGAVGLLLLPILGALDFYLGSWGQATGKFAGWLLLCYSGRRMLKRGFFESPPSIL